MNKMFYLMVIAIIILSGCVGKPANQDNQTNQQTTSGEQNVQNIGKPIQEKIIEIPGFTIKSTYLFAFPKSSTCTVKNIGTQECPSLSYNGNIPDGSKFGGSDTLYTDSTGKRKIKISIKALDNTEGVKELIDELKTRTPTSSRYDIKFGDPKIGEYSIWMTSIDPIDPDILDAKVTFVSKNNFVQIDVTDKKDIGFDEALKIAKDLS